jgi:periplasmic protein TonB
MREVGLVTLRFLISENGQVLSGQVEKSSGYKRLDEAALAALSLCKFKPATRNGAPIQDWSTLRYRWKLEDD